MGISLYFPLLYKKDQQLKRLANALQIVVVSIVAVIAAIVVVVVVVVVVVLTAIRGAASSSASSLYLLVKVKLIHQIPKTECVSKVFRPKSKFFIT